MPPAAVPDEVPYALRGQAAERAVDGKPTSFGYARYGDQRGEILALVP